jgi:NAD(P)-dependent dehydrogenase (short-subunit alcohol dehydrogenase family)
MSKAALDQLTRCASVDLAKYGIRVNAINPGNEFAKGKNISLKIVHACFVLTLLNVQHID